MSLSPKERRELIARSHQLKASVTIAAAGVSEGAIEHVRELLATRELMKVRIQTDSREECDRAADALATRVPCEVVTRVGRVVLLFRAADAEETAD